MIAIFQKVKINTMGDQGDQPRQPRDLEGLLKFCMQATQAEDAPNRESGEDQPMDPERQQCREEAMREMTVDVVQQLAEGMKC